MPRSEDMESESINSNDVVRMDAAQGGKGPLQCVSNGRPCEVDLGFLPVGGEFLCICLFRFGLLRGPKTTDNSLIVGDKQLVSCDGRGGKESSANLVAPFFLTIFQCQPDQPAVGRGNPDIFARDHGGSIGASAQRVSPLTLSRCPRQCIDLFVLTADDDQIFGNGRTVT